MRKDDASLRTIEVDEFAVLTEKMNYAVCAVHEGEEAGEEEIEKEIIASFIDKQDAIAFAVTESTHEGEFNYIEVFLIVNKSSKPLRFLHGKRV